MGRQLYAPDTDWLDTLGMEPDESLAAWTEEPAGELLDTGWEVAAPVVVDLDELMPN